MNIYKAKEILEEVWYNLIRIKDSKIIYNLKIKSSLEKVK